MLMSRLFSASIILLASLAFAADPPAKDAPPAKDTAGAPPARADQPPPQQNRPQQNQRGNNRGFGFGFRPQPPDVFVDTVAALADLALDPDFVLTPEQKESIQSLRADTKMAQNKWRGDNQDELQKLADEAQAARDSGNQDKAREIFQQRQAFMNKGPRSEDAVKKLMGLLNEEQRKRVDERLAQRRAEAEQQRQAAGFGR